MDNANRKLLVIGSGGREHALVQKLLESGRIEKIWVAPGNGGMAGEKLCENLPLDKHDDLVDFAEKNGVDLTICGPEVPLVGGLGDLFRARKLPFFGPCADGARLEGSKAHAKDFMKKYGVSTAAYGRFTSHAAAKEALRDYGLPVVIKADGLAAGKGVIICQTRAEAETALKEIMIERIFGGAGAEVVIEEFLEGKEASILALYDGKTIIPFLSAKDHKKIGEGETGPNTGGMGVISPNPWVTPEVFEAYLKTIQEPTLKGLAAENISFAGIIFFGLMINDRGVFLLEYNMRFGDPETQAVLPLMKGDFLALLEASLKGEASSVPLAWDSGASCSVVLASGGYPGICKRGLPITGLGKVKNHHTVAGAVLKDEVLVTAGGRVLNITATGKTVAEARKKAYADVEKVSFEGMIYRKDIGL
jgi:phosphoribosylamine--glycine ligase